MNEIRNTSTLIYAGNNSSEHAGVLRLPLSVFLGDCNSKLTQRNNDKLVDCCGRPVILNTMNLEVLNHSIVYENSRNAKMLNNKPY